MSSPPRHAVSLGWISPEPGVLSAGFRLSQLPRLGLALALAALAACGRSPSGPAAGTAGPGLGPTERPPVAVTPSLRVELPSPALIEAGRPGETTVLGLITNRSDHAVDNLQIRVSLMDSAGKLLGQQDVPPALRHLDVADVSPYAATFPVEAASGMRASAELVHYRPTRGANTPVQSEIVRTVQLPDGEWAVLGRLTNPGTSSVAVRELAVLAVDAQGRPTGLLPWTAGLGRIPPRGSQPFLAIGPAGEATKAHIGYARAEPESGARRVDLKFAAGPELRQTSQGELFITGALENLSPVPVWGRSAVLFHVDDQLVGLGQVRFPLPMPPGEVRPFSIRLGPLFGVIPAELDPAGISLSGEPESLAATAAEAALVPLDLEIESFEFTGSRAFVRGRVTNPSGHSTATPTVFAAVRSTEGKILGAAWQVVATRLPASATQPFSLSIDLPAQVNPAMAEYDLRALGTEVER